MERYYERYQNLTAGQRKLLCFLAYTGKKTDDKTLIVYETGEDVRMRDMKKLLNSLRPFFKTDYYSYRNEYQIHPHHAAPLMLYMMEKEPELLVHFDDFYKHQQTKTMASLCKDLQACLNGKPVAANQMRPSLDFADYLVPLASDERFLPMMQSVASITRFVENVVIYQLENDIDDPKNVISRIAEPYLKRLTLTYAREVLTVIALYDFFKQGRYDKEALAAKNLLGCILAGAQLLYAGDYAKAFTMMTAAMRERNRDSVASVKGFFEQLVNNYLLLMAYYLHKGDEGRKLGALSRKDLFMERSDHQPAAWLVNYLVSGAVPTQRKVQSYIGEGSIGNGSAFHKYMALLVARFFHLDVTLPKDLPPIPHLRLLRHELSPWLPLSADEKQQLARDFGGEPLLSRIRYKAPWERLLEELTPHEEKPEDAAEKQTRVCYIINYSGLEPREQSRLKSGVWGAGKRMTLSRFCEGADYMDDVDRRIAAITKTWEYYIDDEKALPLLVGSDRVYTGSYAPFTPVTIVEEKPYLIIERTKTAFTVKSNIGNASLNKSSVVRKDSDTHYTVITMTDRQRSYYQKLLAIGGFPLDAEEQLREFLPKVSDVVEVHSDLVEGGTTLQQRDGSPVLCLQALPEDGNAGHYALWCLSRPLTNGKTLLEAGAGLNPCVAEEDDVRYQVTRDMKGERANLQLLRTFLVDNGLTNDDEGDSLFAGRTAVSLGAEGLLQLMDFVRQQTDHFFLEWPEGGRLNLKISQPANWNISLRSRNGWFEVEGDIPIDDDTVLSVGQLLQLVAQSPLKGFVRLSDTDFMAISDRLRKQLARLESLTVSNRGHLQISEFHASLLGSALSGEIDIRHDKKIDELQKKIKKSMAQRPGVPKQLKADLRDYQTEGYQWIARMTGWGAGVCLADDMGLGKTVQTIAFMLHTADEGPALVAAPASVVLNWRRELERFAPSLHVEVLNSAADRKALVEQAQKGDVVLTTYGLFVTEDETLCEKKWNTVCLDEAHVIKNRQTKTSAAVMKLQAQHRIILTGTPVQNHLGELWNLFQFANPGLLGSHEQFHQKYIVPIELQDNKERSRQLKRIVSPFMLRRTKQEVIEELPDKTEINIPVELTDEELAVYEVIRRRAKELLEDEQSASGVSVNTLAEITRLRQASCAAQLVEKNWTGECSKLTALTDLLQEIVDGGNAVLVFSQFTSFLAMVRERLDKQKQPYLYLDGSVPVRQRDQLVQQFQRGECPVFLISLKAGGLGLNLTGANYVIHLDPWWNPAIEQQATDRAYRIGQRQSVTVYHLISQHTIEEKILRLHQTKRNLADAMLSGTNESHKLTSKDLLEMIGK